MEKKKKTKEIGVPRFCPNCGDKRLKETLRIIKKRKAKRKK